MAPKHKRPELHEGDETQFINAATPLLRVILKHPYFKKVLLATAIGYAAVGHEIAPVDALIPGLHHGGSVSRQEFHALEQIVQSFGDQVRQNNQDTRQNTQAVQQLITEVSNLRGRLGMDASVARGGLASTNGVDWRIRAARQAEEE